MTLEYTYDTYASDYTIDDTVLSSANPDLTAISNTLMERIGLFNESDIPVDASHPDNISAFFVLYKVTDSERRVAFFFLKENSSSVITDIDIYRVECQVELIENELKITGCKAYYTPSHFARQNITVALISGGAVLSVGVCGKAPSTPEEDWIPILLSGVRYDLTNGLSSDNTYILTPPKSFFVEGEHEDFAPVGKYPLAHFYEC